jgi:hypothetical protein
MGGWRADRRAKKKTEQNLRERNRGTREQKQKKPVAEWTKGRKRRAKPSFGLVPEFKHNIQIKKIEKKKKKNRGWTEYLESDQKKKGTGGRTGKGNKPKETWVETKKDT